MESNRVEFRLPDDDFKVIEQIARQMGTSVGLAARQLTMSGAKATAGFHQSPAALIQALNSDLEEFRGLLETLNDSTTSGVDGLRRDVQAVDKLLVALLRGILQIVSIARLFGDAHDKALVKSAIEMAEQSMKQMTQARKTNSTENVTEIHA